MNCNVCTQGHSPRSYVKNVISRDTLDANPAAQHSPVQPKPELSSITCTLVSAKKILRDFALSMDGPSTLWF
jgi:hypothetical protein